ncbi:hypothetical protein ACHHYP_06618 [Achlya hypogyna]|uniref:Phosphatidylinositol 3-kinase n=1 Tax=Achlya hypogyna TaxID=1202772 RepID=A0A1V9YSW1_ACHHY|nr:hypothetical protein ACHHYP_06618 [Achlya hypogyna]
MAIVLATAMLHVALATSTDPTCLAACVAGCSCPLGRNGLVCSNNGYCDGGACICADGWASSAGANGTCDIGLVSLNSSVYLFVMLAACVVALVAYSGSLVLIYYGDNAVVAHARPVWAHVMHVGAVLGAASVAVAASLRSSTHACTVLWCLMDVGFVLVFGSLALRLYRNARLLFASSTGPPVKLPDTWVACMLGLLVVAEGAVLTTIGVLGGFDPNLKLWDYPGRVDYRFQGCYLSSTNAGLALVAPKGVYLIAVLALSLRLRRNTDKEREATKLVFCMLATAVLWAIGMAVFATSERAFGEVLYLCLVFLYMLPTAMVGFALAFPKIVAIHRLHQARRRAVFAPTPDGTGVNARLLRVAWDNVEEVEAAEALLDAYDPDVDGDLEMGTLMVLLSDRVCHRKVRRHAANALRAHSLQTLCLYLPQLLQALKHDLDLKDTETSPLLEFLLELAVAHSDAALALYWHVRVEIMDQVNVVINDQEVVSRDRETKPLFAMVLRRLQEVLATADGTDLLQWFNAKPTDVDNVVSAQAQYVEHAAGLYAALTALPTTDVKTMSVELKSFLKASEDSALPVPNVRYPCPHPLYPSVSIRGMDADGSCLFRSSAKPMKLQLVIDKTRLLTSRRSLERTKSRLENHLYTYTVIVDVGTIAGFSGLPILVRVDVHGKRQQTTVPGLLVFRVGVPPKLVECQVFHDAVCLGVADVELGPRGCDRAALNVDDKGTLDVAVVIELQEVTSPPPSGALHPECFAGRSASAFISRPPVSSSVIYKRGDDLRQDQLALQLIAVMDTLLKREGLDLQFTLYRILPTSPNDGFAEFVSNSQPLSSVLSDNSHSIMRFLERHNYDMDEGGVTPGAMDIFVRSVAGYCVATYILGVGDRHLDNLMMKESGHFFHIDFGFLFGRDPKPLPPPFRLTPEMVSAMGGLRGENFQQCMRYASTSFNILRSQAHVLLGVLELSKDAGIPDMVTHMSTTAESAIHEVERRMVLRASNDQAAAFFKDLMVESQNTKTKTRLSLMERIHRLAVAMK